MIENTKKVVYLSKITGGKNHDKKLADESKISYPENASLTQDTGCARLSAASGSGTTTQKKMRGTNGN